MTRTVKIGQIEIGRGHPLALIAGPCVAESEQIVLQTARMVKETAEKLDVPVIFKASYAKANRLRGESYAGPGLQEGLRILARVKQELDLPILTDVHLHFHVIIISLGQISVRTCCEKGFYRVSLRDGHGYL